MKFYDHPASGNGWKVRLLLAFAGIRVDSIIVDVAAGAHKTPAFLAINPRGQIPVLVDGDTVLFDSQAILVYLAAGRAPNWLPRDPAGLGAVTQWLSFAAKDMAIGLQAARLHVLIGAPVDFVAAQTEARKALGVLETWLATRTWLVDDRPTIADIACHPYAALAPEGRVSLDDYPAVRAWISRLQSLPGYLQMAPQTH